MLAVFDRKVAKSPEGLRSPGTEGGDGGRSLLDHFLAARAGAVAINLGSSGGLAYTSKKQTPLLPRLFAVVDDIFCLFQGHIENITSLKQQYGLGKTANEVIIVIEAYKTLRDRGPFPASQVLRDLNGKFAFTLFDSSSNTTFMASDADGSVPFFWGADAQDHLVLSDDADIVKKGCGKSFAPFPKGCFFTTSGGLQSFEHPMNELKPMPRVDSQGQVCGATYNVDYMAKKDTGMPRVGSSANCTMEANILRCGAIKTLPPISRRPQGMEFGHRMPPRKLLSSVVEARVQTEEKMVAATEKTTYTDNWFDRLAIRYLSRSIQATTDKDLASTVNIHERDLCSFHHSVLPLAGWPLPGMGFLAAPSAFMILSVRKSEVDGKTEKNVVYIPKCRFLESTNCVGMCTNLCKVPSQKFIQDSLGVPVYMVPNFEDMSCEMVFGQQPPLHDPTLKQPCYHKSCNGIDPSTLTGKRIPPLTSSNCDLICPLFAGITKQKHGVNCSSG
ncbi:Stem-specific protein TSJT1 [Musa troglodytarum]|uniref:Stem-specific protein TSJT1 n=1 Tax=Musa troglodytarum TaxID=320322 RepID=A0A9E7F1Q4_9LILI|nr:Stem-specific protein TSJT1 [Musa troglodytarum]